MAMMTTSCAIEFPDFPWPTIATLYMAVPSDSVGTEYLCQIVKLHSLQEILWTDLVLGGDSTHPVHHSSVIALQAMQSR